MCESSNNSSIDNVTNKNMAHASEDLAKLKSLFNFRHNKNKIKNIYEIIGDKE